MASRDELLQALRNASAAADQGDPQAAQAAQQLAQMLQGGQFDDAQAPQTPQAPAAPQAPVDQSGSFVDSAAQGVSFGFSDEIAGGLGASVNSAANLFGAGTGDSFGEAYTSIRDGARKSEKAFSARNPKTALAAELAGGLLTGGAGLAKVGALKGGQKIAKLASVGAAQGGAVGAGKSEAEDIGGLLQDTAQGAALGGVTGAAAPAIGRATGGLLSSGVKGANKLLGGGNNKVRAAAVDTLDKFNIPLTASQRGGSQSLGATETTLSGVPFVGGALEKTFDNQRQAFQRQALKMAGFAERDVKDGLVTPEAIQRARDKFTERYTASLGDTKINVGDDFVENLAKVQERFSSTLAGGKSKKIENIVNDLFDRASKKNLTGKEYQSLRSELGTLSRSAKAREQEVYQELKRALDDEFLDAAGATVGKAKKAVDTQFAHFKQIETLNKRNAGGADGIVSGNLPIGQLARLASGKPGSAEWRKFLDASAAILPDRTPNSGTAQRALTSAGLLGGSAINPAAVATGVTAGNLTSRALANPQAVQRGAQAVGQGADAAGILAAPAVVGQDLGLPGSLQNQLRGLLR